MHEIIYQNRIPKDFFITKGVGESNISQHNGSFYLALKSAGIEKYNIMTFSSMLPKESIEVSKQDNIVFGSVMDTIMAVGHGTRGQTIGSGVGFGWLHDKETDEKIGGIVCEQVGYVTRETIKKRLLASLSEIYLDGFHDKYLLKNLKLICIDHDVIKKFGTCVAAICFINHIYCQI